MADQIAKRFRAMMNPAVLAADEADENAPPPPPPPPGPEEITAKAKADEAVANAKKADSEAQMADLELGTALADSVLGPDPAEMQPQTPGQPQPAPAMPQAA